MYDYFLEHDVLNRCGWNGGVPRNLQHGGTSYKVVPPMESRIVGDGISCGLQIEYGINV